MGIVYHLWRNGKRVWNVAAGEHKTRVMDVREDWRGRMLIDVELLD